jgi:hypothetical protein
MRDAMTPGEMDRWRAFRQLQPDPLERIAVILKLGFTAICNSWGAKLHPDDFEPAAEKKAKDDVMTPNQAAALATSMLGRPHGIGNR